MSTIMQDVGRKLRNYRQKRKMTQEDLAEKAELHYTYIGQVERGEKNLTLMSLEKILNALEVSFVELFEDVETQPKHEDADFAAMCYELVSGKSEEEQKHLYCILCEIEMLIE